MHKPNRSITALVAMLMLLPLIAACGGGTPAVDQPTPSGAQAQPTSAPAPAEATAAPPAAPEATSAPAATAAADATAAPAGTDATATGAEAQPIGEQLDLANLSPDVADPTEPVTIKFASWVGETRRHAEVCGTVPRAAPQYYDRLPRRAGRGDHRQAADPGGRRNRARCRVPGSERGRRFRVAQRAGRLDDYVATSNAVKPDDYVASFCATRRCTRASCMACRSTARSTGLFYRTDLFEAAGIAGPPKTWQEFEEAAKKLTNKDKKQYGFILFAPGGGLLLVPLAVADRRQAAVGGRQADPVQQRGRQARGRVLCTAASDYSPEDFLNSNSYDGRVAFANGTVAMYVAGAWFAGTLRSEFPDIDGKWAAAPLPEDKQCATTIAGDTLVIFEQSKNKDAAWKWIEFLSAPQNMALWNLGTAAAPGSLLPPRNSLIEDPRAFENNDTLKGFAEHDGVRRHQCWPITRTGARPRSC